MREDSTKGKARIMPVNYKGDVLVQAWIDARKLAVLSIWLDKGYETKHLSDLIKFTVDELVSQLVETGIVEKIEFSKDARDLLMMKYRAQLNPGGRGERNALHNLHLDELRRGNVYRDERSKTVYGTGIPQIFDIDKAVKIYKEKERNEKIEEQIKKQTIEAFKDPRIVEVDNEIKVDVEKNLAKAKENDEKLKNMP